jgi:hypothetical protein
MPRRISYITRHGPNWLVLRRLPVAVSEAPSDRESCIPHAAFRLGVLSLGAASPPLQTPPLQWSIGRGAYAARRLRPA